MKLPWRLETILGYRPRKTIVKPIYDVLKSTNDKIPYNALKKVAEGYSFILTKPIEYLNDFRHHFFLENTKIEVEPVYFGSIKNGRYCQYNLIPTIIDPSNRIIDSAQRHPYYYNPWKNEYHHPLLSCKKISAPKKIKGKVLSLGTDGGHNGYFHFMARIIPKLSVLEELGISLKEFSVIIINGPSQEFKLSTLKELGIPLEKVIFAKDGEHFQAEYLFFVPRIRYHKMGINFLRESLIQKEKDPLSQNLFIGREDAKFRKLVNQKDFIKENQNLQSIILSQKTIKEQVSLFNQSNLTVGVHGAGLTNIVFSEPNSTLIEILDDAYVNINYWFFSNLIDVNYIPIIGKSVVTDKSLPPNMKSNIKLNEQLQRKLSDAIKKYG